MTIQGKFDTEKFQNRLFSFASDCRLLATKLPRVEYNLIYSGQLIRSAASPGANYIEALEAMSTKDFVHKLRISRKEARESAYWIRHIKKANGNLGDIAKECDRLIGEGTEITKILSSSIITLEKRVQK